MVSQNDGEEIQSIADSEFVQTELADFVDDEEQQEHVGEPHEDEQEQQQPNIGHQNVLDWTFDQNSTGNATNMQIGMLKTEITVLEKNCTILEEKLENMKLRAIIQQEAHEKEIGQMRRDYAASQQKIEQLENVVEEQARQVEEMEADLLEKCQQEMDEKEEAANEKIGKLEREMAEMQKKMEGMAKEIERMRQREKEGKEAVANKKWHLCNSVMNKWQKSTTRLTILGDHGLIAMHQLAGWQWKNVLAVVPFSSSAGDGSHGGIHIQYFELTSDWCHFDIGLTADHSNRNDDDYVGKHPNSYSIYTGHIHSYRFSGTEVDFLWPSDALRPKIHAKGRSNVFGCGLLVWPDKKRSIFFTANGTLLGKRIPIGTIDVPLYPVGRLGPGNTVEANFGANPANPFAYDLAKCSGLFV